MQVGRRPTREFGVLILLPAVGYRFLGLNRVIAFWIAYTITRPLGASFADWLGVPAPYGDGLQLGTDVMSLLFGVILLALVLVIAPLHGRTTPALPEPGVASAHSTPEAAQR